MTIMQLVDKKEAIENGLLAISDLMSNTIMFEDSSLNVQIREILSTKKFKLHMELTKIIEEIEAYDEYFLGLADEHYEKEVEEAFDKLIEDYDNGLYHEDCECGCGVCSCKDYPSKNYGILPSQDVYEQDNIDEVDLQLQMTEFIMTSLMENGLLKKY